MTMYGIEDLKAKLEVTESKVACPFRDCLRQVDRQRKAFQCESRRIGRIKDSTLLTGQSVIPKRKK